MYLDNNEDIIWSEEKRELEEAENNEGKKMILKFSVKWLTFLSEGKNVNVNSGNTIITPEYILYHSKIHAWELSSQ